MSLPRQVGRVVSGVQEFSYMDPRSTACKHAPQDVALKCEDSVTEWRTAVAPGARFSSVSFDPPQVPSMSSRSIALSL